MANMMSRRAVWLAAWAALALAVPAYAAAEKCQLSLNELPVKIEGRRVVSHVGIGDMDVPLTVDSGAFFSMLTEAAAEQLHLPTRHAPFGYIVEGAAGDIDIRLAKVPHVRLLGGELSAPIEFIVGGNDPGSGTMGLLGRNILGALDAEYDLVHGRISLVVTHGDCGGDHVMAYWAKDEAVSELRIEAAGRETTPALQVEVLVGDTKVQAVLDTGAPSTVLWRSAARRAGIADSAMEPAGIARGAGHGEAKSWVAKVPRVQIAGETITNSKLEIADFPVRRDGAEMLLGLDFFLSHRIYFSRDQHRIWFTYNGGQIFTLNTVTEADAPDTGPLPDADAYAHRAAVFAARGDFARALVDLDRACERSPQSADLLFHRGQAHESLKQAPEALRDYEAAVRLDPARGDARLAHARLALDAGRREDALADAKVLDGRLPAESNERRALARLYARLDLPGLERAQLAIWLKTHSREVDADAAWNQSCWAGMQQGTFLDQALADCERALDEKPKESRYLDSRGWVRLRQEAWRDARRDFDRALQQAPDRAWSLYGRGIARLHDGDAAGGDADLAAARKLMPEIDASAAKFGMAAQRPVPASGAASAP